MLGGTFLAAIEATIVATAMPTVVEQFGGLAHYSWVFSAYMLTSTVTMPIWGKLSDLYGRRPFYTAAVALFLLGSALAGASQSMAQLIAFRAIQGIGAGGLLPLGMTILGDIYTTDERARMQGLFSMVWGLASIVGPLVGGYLTETLSWRWVFYLNVPFGVGAAALVGLALVDAAPHKAPRVDVRGAVLLTLAVGVLLVALNQTGAADALMGAPALALTYAAAVLLAAWFLRSQRAAPEPILPLALFTDRVVSTTTACGFLLGLAMFGTLGFVPLFVQHALGGTAVEAGRALTPLLLGWVTMSVVASRLLRYAGYRRLIQAGVGMVAAGLTGLAQASHAMPRPVLAMTLGLMGMGMGTAMLSLLLALQGAVPRAQLGIATSMGQFSRSIGGAVGVALLGAIVAASAPATAIPDARSLESALHNAFATAAVLAGLAFALSWRIPAALSEASPRP